MHRLDFLISEGDVSIEYCAAFMVEIIIERVSRFFHMLNLMCPIHIGLEKALKLLVSPNSRTSFFSFSSFRWRKSFSRFRLSFIIEFVCKSTHSHNCGQLFARPPSFFSRAFVHTHTHTHIRNCHHSVPNCSQLRSILHARPQLAVFSFYTFLLHSLNSKQTAHTQSHALIATNFQLW